MRYSRAPYEKAKEDLAKALRGEGIQPPAPSAIPISDYYHVADAEIEALLARQRDESERYRLILEHQAQSHRYMKFTTDGERNVAEDEARGRRDANSSKGNRPVSSNGMGTAEAAASPPRSNINTNNNNSSSSPTGGGGGGGTRMPPLFDPRRLDPKEEQKAMLARSMDRFLPSIVVPTAEERNTKNATYPAPGGGGGGGQVVALAPLRHTMGIGGGAGAMNSNNTNSNNRSGLTSPITSARGTVKNPHEEFLLGGVANNNATNGSNSPATQARLRHRSAKEQQLALLSQMVDPSTGERVRLVENPYRRQREELEEQTRRRHLQAHTTALLRPLLYEEASEVREPYKVLLETQAMLRAGKGAGDEGPAFDRKAWRRESLLGGDHTALVLAPDALAEHLHLNRASQSAPSSSSGAGAVVRGRSRSQSPNNGGGGGRRDTLLTTERLAALKAKAQTPEPGMTMMNSGRGTAEQQQNSDAMSMSNTMSRANRLMQQAAEDLAEAEALRADRLRRSGLKNWRNNKEDHLARQAQFAVDDRMTQRQHYSSLNQRYKAIESKMEEAHQKALVAEEARTQEVLRQAESRMRSNAMEALRNTDADELSARRRIEAEENLFVNKHILLPFEAGLHAMRPLMPLLPSPAVGALPVDDVEVVGEIGGGGGDAYSVYNNDSRLGENDSYMGKGAGLDEDGMQNDYTAVRSGDDVDTDAEGSPDTYFKRNAGAGGGGRNLRIPGVGANGRMAFTTFLGDDGHSHLHRGGGGRGGRSGNTKGGDEFGDFSFDTIRRVPSIATEDYNPNDRSHITNNNDDDGFGGPVIPLTNNNNPSPQHVYSNRRASISNTILGGASNNGRGGGGGGGPHRIGTGFKFASTAAQQHQQQQHGVSGSPASNTMGVSLSPRNGGDGDGGGSTSPRGFGGIRKALSIYGDDEKGGGSTSPRNVPHSEDKSSVAAPTTTAAATAAAAAAAAAAASAVVVYATLKPIEDSAPASVKTWATPFFDTPTPMTTMRAIASSLGLMDAPTVATTAVEGGDVVGANPFQRVASLYAPSTVNSGLTPRGGVGGALRHRNRERAKPLGFVGL